MADENVNNSNFSTYNNNYANYLDEQVAHLPCKKI